MAQSEAARGRPYQLSELELLNGGSFYVFRCFMKQMLSKLPAKPHGMREDQQLVLRSFSGAVEIATVCEESALPWPRDAVFSARGRLAEQALGLATAEQQRLGIGLAQGAGDQGDEGCGRPWAFGMQVAGERLQCQRVDALFPEAEIPPAEPP